jgi:hypothetical protein
VSISTELNKVGINDMCEMIDRIRQEGKIERKLPA